MLLDNFPFNAYSVACFAFTLAVRHKSTSFLLSSILSLPLRRHRTARWRSLVGTEQSPLCRREAQCCWRAASGSRWGITSEKWSNEREEMLNELWTAWLGVFQWDVLICWWRPFPRPGQLPYLRHRIFQQLFPARRIWFFHFEACISGVFISLFASQTPHGHINTWQPVCVDKAQQWIERKATALGKQAHAQCY